jgi:polyferredoxin
MNKDRKRHIADCLVITAALIILRIITEHNVYLYIAVGISILAAFLPFFAKMVSYIWQSVGIGLGFVVSKVILSAVFYLILFPISLLQKLFSTKSSISKKKQKTYWIDKENKTVDFNKPW